MLSVDDEQRTALHVQTSHDRAAVVEYLCNLFSNNDTFLLAKDSAGRTAYCILLKEKK